MANTAEGLIPRLSTQLRDPSLQTWGRDELESLLTQAIARLYPRISRPMDPTSTTIALVDGTAFYALPAGVLSVSRVDLVDADSVERGSLPPGTWEIVGDPFSGAGKLRVAEQITRIGGTLRINGYGAYEDVPEQYVTLVLATARAEAIRRLMGDRARFKQWAVRNQVQNISVNELAQMVNEADAEADLQRRTHVTWRKPLPGRAP